MKIKLTAAVIIAMSLYCVSSGVVPSPIIPTQINYQGVLKNSAGSMITNPSLPVVFSIYSAAGTALWTETQTVSVDAGVYSVQLGSVTLIPIDGSVFDGNTRYLGIKVGSDAEMTPRVALVSVPYAYKAATANFATSATTAQTANALSSGAGLTTGMLTAEILGSGPGDVAIFGRITSSIPGSLSSAILGKIEEPTAVSGFGVEGLHAGDGIGVYGKSAGSGSGVYGLSTDGRGVYGQSTNSGYGVYGASSNNIGVYGTGPIAGGSFESTGGYAVYGNASGSGPNPVYGGYFVSPNNSAGAGVYGDGLALGIAGHSDGGTGVSGSTNTGTGVSGTTSVGGIGVLGGSDSGVGVKGQSQNTGVYGLHYSTWGGAAPV